MFSSLLLCCVTASTLPHPDKLNHMSAQQVHARSLEVAKRNKVGKYV